ncbi:MAG: hypothetical protein NT033_00275, partial [Candidatus Omnitrophica bacterium]|nr:hypothetical protein [Candidatus Omnitrophota bacterium]
LSKDNPLFDGADIVRFVSLRRMNDDEARNKDWVGVDSENRVTAFIPRRSLEEMEVLADKGLLQRREDGLYGGINLGSVAISYDLLEVLLTEFQADVLDPQVKRQDRPDLDPQFFTALCIATIADPAAREIAWQEAITTIKAMRDLNDKVPGILSRIRRALDNFEQKRNQPVKLVAMDFLDQYWADIGQHTKMFDFFTLINQQGVEAEISRAHAGIDDLERDANGNIFIGDCVISPDIEATNSIFFEVRLTGRGYVDNSVLIGTETIDIQATNAFDFQSIAPAITLENRAGTYMVLEDQPIQAKEKMRLTTLFMPTHGTQLMQVHEDDDLRRDDIYGKVKDGIQPAPIHGNAVTFVQAHEDMEKLNYGTLQELRAQRR